MRLLSAERSVITAEDKADLACADSLSLDEENISGEDEGPPHCLNETFDIPKNLTANVLGENTLDLKKGRLSDCQATMRPTNFGKSEFTRYLDRADEGFGYNQNSSNGQYPSASDITGSELGRELTGNFEYTQFSGRENIQNESTQIPREDDPPIPTPPPAPRLRPIDSVQPFDLLGLPFEVREIVYKDVLLELPSFSLDHEAEVEEAIEPSERGRPPSLIFFGPIPQQLRLTPLNHPPPWMTLPSAPAPPGQAPPPLWQQSPSNIARVIAAGSVRSGHRVSRIEGLATPPESKRDTYLPGFTRLSFALPYCKYATQHDTEGSFIAGETSNLSSREQDQNAGARGMSTESTSSDSFHQSHRSVEENSNTQPRFHGSNNPSDPTGGHGQSIHGDDFNGQNTPNFRRRSSSLSELDFYALEASSSWYSLNEPEIFRDRENHGSWSSDHAPGPGASARGSRKRSLSNRMKFAILKASTATYNDARRILYDNVPICLDREFISRILATQTRCRFSKRRLVNYLLGCIYQARILELRLVLMPDRLCTKTGHEDHRNLHYVAWAFLEIRRKYRKAARSRLRIKLTVACEPEKNEKAIFHTARSVFIHHEKPAIDFSVRIAASLTCPFVGIMLPDVAAYRAMLEKAKAGFEKIGVPVKTVYITKEPWF